MILDFNLEQINARNVYTSSVKVQDLNLLVLQFLETVERAIIVN